MSVQSEPQSRCSAACLYASRFLHLHGAGVPPGSSGHVCKDGIVLPLPRVGTYLGCRGCTPHFWAVMQTVLVRRASVGRCPSKRGQSGSQGNRFRLSILWYFRTCLAWEGKTGPEFGNS